MKPASRGLWLLIPLVLAGATDLAAQEGIDVDAWHAKLAEELGTTLDGAEPRRSAFGLYPSAGAVLGPPNWASVQTHLYLSYTAGNRFRVFGGYGIEHGPSANARVFTLGWGGVRRLQVASRQVGFHGKFVRYRRWDDEQHGIHHGLSVGTEHGAGYFAIGFEVGAARSQRNHWMFVAQIAVKVGLPIHLPAGKKPARKNG